MALALALKISSDFLLSRMDGDGTQNQTGSFLRPPSTPATPRHPPYVAWEMLSLYPVGNTLPPTARTGLSRTQCQKGAGSRAGQGRRRRQDTARGLGERVPTKEGLITGRPAGAGSAPSLRPPAVSAGKTCPQRAEQLPRRVSRTA